MASRKRDFPAEYARRNAKAVAEGFSSYNAKRASLGISSGLSKSQALGKPRKFEVPASIQRLPSTRRNWIANEIKQISSDLRGNPYTEPEAEVQYKKIIKAHNDLRKEKTSKGKDKKVNEIIDAIRDFNNLYDDDLDFTIGDTP